MIRLENVSFRYPKASSDTLFNVTLTVPGSSFFALLGPNGAGKTTLLRLLCGRLGNFKGNLEIADDCRNVRGFLKSTSYGVLLENPGFYPKLSIEEYLSYFAGFYGLGENACMPGGSARERFLMLAERLQLPEPGVRMGMLSLGNRQKVQLVRAMIHEPKILILDEPVANLDPVSRESVWELIDEWRKVKGCTAIVCSHILAEMDRWATNFAIIDRGRVLQSGVNLCPDGAESDFSKKFEVKLKMPLSCGALKKILHSAGLDPIDVAAKGTTLAEVYRMAIGTEHL